MAEILTSKNDNDDRVKAVNEAKRLGVMVLPPDINKSDTSFTIEDTQHGKAIRFGLGAISGIANADAVTAIRPVISLDDFTNRVNGTAINKGKVVNLILAGAFDQFESNRHKLHNYYLGTIRKFNAVDAKTYENLKKAKKHNTSYVPRNDKNFTDKMKYDYERDLMGMPVSGNILDKYPYTPWNVTNVGQPIEAYGMVSKIRVYQDRYGRAYAFFKLETLGDVREAVCWSKEYGQYGDRLTEGALVIIRGRKDNSRGNDQLVTNEILVAVDRIAKNSIKNNNVNLIESNIQHSQPIANPFDDLYNTDSVNNIIYGNDNNNVFNEWS